uniref:Uncharacterized protein n=1 Tax=Timema poppense TaxID=170557 RepID=A0A7R9D8F7_TIMPO|nr:unnamed protein product [Timema poppensis]
MGLYSSPMASLVLTDSSQLTSGSQHLDLQIHPTSPNGNALIAYDPKQHNSSKYWISNIESFLKAAHGQCKMARSKRLGLSHASQYRFDRRMLNARNEISRRYELSTYTDPSLIPGRSEKKVNCDYDQPPQKDQIEGWEPEFYSDVANLPVDMPTELKEHIEYIQRRKPLQTIAMKLSAGKEDGPLGS